MLSAYRDDDTATDAPAPDAVPEPTPAPAPAPRKVPAKPQPARPLGHLVNYPAGALALG
jgi:hypothetical protein